MEAPDEGGGERRGHLSAIQASAEKRRQFDKLPIEVIEKNIEELEEQNQRLATENELFESYILHQKINERLGEEEAIRDEQSKGTRKHGKRAQTKNRAVVQRELTNTQKYEIGKAEYVELEKAREQARRKFENQVAEIRAHKEESLKSKQDLILDRKKFHREVEEKGVNPIPGHGNTIMSEKIIRYYDEKLKARDNLMAKLIVRNQALKRSNKLDQERLTEKEEKNEVVQQIDFGQLAIENQQYLAKIEERSDELLRLKTLAASAVHTLNKHKNELSMLSAKSAHLKEEIKARENTLQKILMETKSVQSESDQCRESNQKLKMQQEEFIVPEVLTYVKQNDEQYVLRKTVKDWERKVEIAEMALKRQKVLAAQATGKQQTGGATGMTDTRRPRGTPTA